SAQPAWLLAALFLLLPNLFFQYRKWKLLLRSAYPALDTRQVRESLFLGFAFGVVTPARIGEFGGRAAGVRGADRLTLIGLTAVDKVATLAVTVGAGAVGLLLFCFRHPFMSPWTLLAMEIACAAVLTAFLHFRSRRSATRTRSAGQAATEAPSVEMPATEAPSTEMPATEAPSGEAPATDGRIGRHLRLLRGVLRSLDAGTRRGLLLFSILFYATFVLQFFLLLRAFGPVEPFSALAAISSIMLIKTVVPPMTLGELGIREGASVLVLGYAGTVAAVALGASLLLFSINILLPGLAGLAVLLRRPAPRGKT
ncbi:MAG: lysylphosphatidylglycerol synthase domain-containing protein, partial [Bacteroidota bacterium]|nr:lysylphosphatidylglycerol synthase domain-containing protein [Bacteroidota bacterium]